MTLQQSSLAKARLENLVEDELKKIYKAEIE